MKVQCKICAAINPDFTAAVEHLRTEHPAFAANPLTRSLRQALRRLPPTEPPKPKPEVPKPAEPQDIPAPGTMWGYIRK